MFVDPRPVSKPSLSSNTTPRFATTPFSPPPTPVSTCGWATASKPPLTIARRSIVSPRNRNAASRYAVCLSLKVDSPRWSLYTNSGTATVLFKLNPSAAQPLYLQLMRQIRHAIETGVLQRGDELPGIRTLAKELVVSHNTVAKAYTELEHGGLLELRHGSGAFVSGKRGAKTRPHTLRLAS